MNKVEKIDVQYTSVSPGTIIFILLNSVSWEMGIEESQLSLNSKVNF